MHLRELTLRAAPGLSPDLHIGDLRPGLMVLWGANASGKSTIGRTIGGLLSPGDAPEGVDASSIWKLGDEDGGMVRGTLAYGAPHWDPPDRWSAPSTQVTSVWTLTLRDLIQTRDGADSDIAREIHRQLSGGFDLPDIAQQFQPRPRLHRTKNARYREARTTLRAHLDAQAGLAAQEQELVRLKSRRRAATAAPSELDAVRRATSLVDQRAQLEALQASLEDYPDEARTLPPGAVAAATEHERVVAQQGQDLDEIEEALIDNQARADELAFPGEVPSRAWLEDLVERAERLSGEEDELRAAKLALTKSEARLREAASAVWTKHCDTHPTRREIEALWDCATAVDVAARALQAWIEHLERLASPEDPGDIGSLQAALDLLIKWQAAPRPAGASAAPAPSKLLLGLGLAVGCLLLAAAIVLVILGQVVPGLAFAIPAVGILAAVLTRWLAAQPRGSSATASQVDALRDAYLREGHTAPDDWTTDAVGRKITQLDTLLRKARDDERAIGERGQAEAKMKRLGQDLDEHRRALSSLSSSLGLDPSFPTLALGTQAERLRALSEARIEHAEAKTSVDDLGSSASSSHTQLRESLASFSSLDLPPLEDGRGIGRAARLLLRRLDELEQVREQGKGLERRKRKAEERLREKTLHRDEHWAACQVDVGDLARLSRLEELHEVWKEEDRQREVLEREIQRAEVALSRWRDLQTASPEELALRAQELEALIADSERVSEEVARIEREIQAATEGHAVADLASEVERARDDLVADRDEQLEKAAGAAMVAWLQERRDQDATPALLSRARAWFLSFTNNRYELRVSHDGHFEALDLEIQRPQRLSELSDATRVQLVLAARLAFIEHAEAGTEPVPLFLDEVLSTSDPERFRGVATAVLTLASRGRQVFYATASEDEVVKLRALDADLGLGAVHVVPLGQEEPAWEEVPAAPSRHLVPSPEGHDAASYAQALGLGCPDLHTDAGTWPLALVLHDDLHAVHAAARDHVVLLGQLEALVRAGVRLPLDVHCVQQAQTRGEVLDAALSALRIGRGRPVDWPTVEACSAITPAFIDRVRALVQQHGAEPELLVERIAALRRFGPSKVDQLRAHLLSTGHLDDRSPLSLDEVVTRTQVAVRSRIETGELELGDVATMVAWVKGVVLPSE